ncbi:glycosyltransferase family 9 protein [Vallicoccus soli]|uniref:Lipopolysaccharide heptosyltransferase family protein n=1 Tax=Vallicoccus soli TaxID=2339232 RepID=A0A3A3YZF4_9ACTN|nr:glycosyltransferase family 9 protein [Vallicoccus soli]RJK95449.1 lipopolysaccharide heptosyltransferase family protein [Vallicoccus soli]
MSGVGGGSEVPGARDARDVRDVLVVELLGGFGDLLLALPAVHALARSHPGARVGVLTFTPGDALLRHDPHVHRVLATSDHAEGAPRAAVAAALEQLRPDLVVTTTTYDGIADLCRSTAPWAVTDLWAGAPDGQRVDRRFLELLVAAGAVREDLHDLPLTVHLAPGERARGAQVLAAAVGDGPGGPPVVLVPEAGMPVKEWPAERWAGLADRLRRRGRPVVAATASGTSPVPGVPGLAPQDLRGLAAALAAAGDRGGAVVGADTGPVRLATAVGTPAVALVGPTSAGRYGLDPRQGTSLQGLPGCPVRRPRSITEQECWWSAACPLTGGGGPACMADLGVDEVLAALDGLERPRRAGALPADGGAPLGRPGAPG